MTESRTVRTGVDTFAWSGKAGAEYPNAARLRIDSGEAYAYLRFDNPVPPGATVVSATLRISQAGDWAGSRTLTVQRIADPWRVARTNWTNRPAVGGTAVAVTAADTTHGAWWSFDVTADMQAFVSGAVKNRGWRLSTSDTVSRYVRGLNASVGKPTLEVVWSETPDAPSNLSPAAGVVSVQFPVLRFHADDDLEAVRVQINDTADETTVTYDSQLVPTDNGPQFTTQGTTWAGLVDGETAYWRVMVRDVDGLDSAWSDWAAMTRDVKGAVTIDSPAPAPNDFVSESTPPILWTFTGGTQAFWQVLVTRADKPASYVYNSQRRAGTETSHAIPKGVITQNGTRYVVTVRVWDAVDREATPGDPTFAAASREFSFEFDPTPAPVTWVNAEQTGDAEPWVRLTWDRSTAPDTFVVVRDGKILDADAEPAETHVSGTLYSLVDYTASPNRAHTYSVRPVVNGKTASAGPQTIFVPRVSGVWLIDPETGAQVVLFGDDEGSWEMGEDAATFTPLGAEATVRIVAGMRGHEGSLSGLLVDGWGYDVEEMLATLLEFKADPAKTYRLVAGDVNIPVVLGEITPAPSPQTRPEGVVRPVSFSFWQNGEISHRPRL